jgi:hypothetical protein
VLSIEHTISRQLNRVHVEQAVIVVDLEDAVDRPVAIGRTLFNKLWA